MKYKIIRRLAPAVLTLVLAGCASSVVDTRFDVEMERLARDVETGPAVAAPASVESSKASRALPLDGRTFDVSVDGSPVGVFLLGLVEGTPYNVVVHPDVTGAITLELKEVTVTEVLSILSSTYGIHVQKEGRLFRIMPNSMQTRIFTMDYVDLKRRGVSDMQVSTGSIREAGSGGSSNNASDSARNNSQGEQGGSGGSEVVGSRVTTQSENDLWGALSDAVNAIVGEGEGRRVITMPQSGVIVVRALLSELEAVGAFLSESEESLQRQVILEAKILEVALSEGYERGINWTEFGQVGGADGGPVNLGLEGRQVANGTAAGLNGVFGIEWGFPDFEGIIQLLETQGAVRVLSSPRIATVNNQKAVIKVGTDEFFVTNVTSTTTTGTSTTTTPSVTLMPFFSGIALDVTPQISSNGDIVLHIHPTVSEVNDQSKLVTIGGDVVNLPLALSTIRESDSIVKARNEQIIVIGGLMKTSNSNDTAGAPLLSRLPVIGGAFGQRSGRAVTSELVILVKPIISDLPAQKEWVDESLQRARLLGHSG